MNYKLLNNRRKAKEFMMKKIRKTFNKVFLTTTLCLSLVLAMSTRSLAAEVRRVMYNFNTQTVATHTLNSATGMFSATARPGATTSPMCSINVSATDANGTAYTNLTLEGTDSANLTLYIGNNSVGGSRVVSTFLGVFCAYVSG